MRERVVPMMVVVAAAMVFSTRDRWGEATKKKEAFLLLAASARALSVSFPCDEAREEET